MRSGPSQSIQACLSHAGHGAAMWNTVFNDDMSTSRTSSGKRMIRCIIVGTSSRNVGRNRATSARVCSASNRRWRTTWLPWTRPSMVIPHGAVWYSGPGTSTTSREGSRYSGAASSSMVAGTVLRISLGRPVLPPEVVARQAGLMRTPRGCAMSDKLGSGTCGTQLRPGWSAGCTPTTSCGSASSMIAWRSACGSRLETGSIVAPTFKTARAVSTNSTEFGKAMQTTSPASTPRPSRVCASLCERSSRWRKVSVSWSTVSAGWSGTSCAHRRNASTMLTTATINTLSSHHIRENPRCTSTIRGTSVRVAKTAASSAGERTSMQVSS